LDLDSVAMEEIQRRVDQAGIAFMAEFARRQCPATLRLKELLATVLGPPRLLFCHQRLPLDVPATRTSDRRPTRSMRQELIELVDWCRYVVDKEPKWVTGMTWHSAGARRGDDYRMMSLDFSDGEGPGPGPVAQISCGRYIPSGWAEAATYRPLAAMQISCQRGIAFVDLPATVIWFDEAGRHQESLETERPVGEQLLTQFYRAVTSLVSKCNLQQACQALWIVEQAHQSHCEGRRVKL
jgi:predicted dehydrogenase